MTEYNFGAGDHISGGLAQADVLGIFGREGLYLGNYWGDGPGNGNLPELHQVRLPPVPELRRQARHVRRHGGRGDARRHRQGVDLRGDRHEAQGPADDPGDQQGAALDLQRKIALKGGKYAKAQVYTLDGSSPDIKPQAPIDVKNGQIEYKLPPVSAALFVVN